MVPQGPRTGPHEGPMRPQGPMGLPGPTLGTPWHPPWDAHGTMAPTQLRRAAVPPQVEAAEIFEAVLLQGLVKIIAELLNGEGVDLLPGWSSSLRAA